MTSCYDDSWDSREASHFVLSEAYCLAMVSHRPLRDNGVQNI